MDLSPGDIIDLGVGVLSICSTAVGLWVAFRANKTAELALAFSHQQADDNDLQYRVSIQPCLTIKLYHYTNLKTNVEYLILGLRNSGLGPALITDWTIRLDGTSYPVGETGRVLSQMFHGTRYHNLLPGIVIGKHEMLDFVCIPTSSHATSAIIQKELLEHGFGFTIHYASLIGQSFTFETADHHWLNEAPLKFE